MSKNYEISLEKYEKQLNEKLLLTQTDLMPSYSVEYQQNLQNILFMEK